MKRIGILLIASAFGLLPAIALSPIRTLADPPRHRVVLIQTDAVKADFLDQFLADGTLPADGGFAMLSHTYKSSLQTVITPSITSPNMTTMVTGVYPQKHGAIANTYPLPTATVTSYVWGHLQPLDSEGIWTPALNAGKKVGLIRTVGVNDTSGVLTNSWTLEFQVEDAGYKLFQPQQTDWQAAIGWNLGSLSAHAPKVVTFTLQDNIDPAQAVSYTFNLLAIDQAAAGVYDALVIDDDRDLSDGYFGARPAQDGAMMPTSPITATGNWSSVVFTSTNIPQGLSDTLLGAYVKVYHFSSDLSSMKFYLGGVWHNPGYPREWVNQLYRSIGPFPRLDSVIESGVLTDQDSRDFSHREDNFFRDAALNVLQQPDWDMVITYQGIVDNFEHAYLLTDPRQISYTDPISVTYWNYIKESYRSVDAAITTISNTVGLTQTDIVVASDHGQAPIHTTVYINRLLAKNGLAVTPPIIAYAQGGGGYADIYINTTARSGGVISPAGTQPYTQTQAAIVAALTNFTDTDRLTGATVHVFDNVIRHQALAASGLLTDTSGDVFVTARPGYSISEATDSGPLTSALAYGGTHGYAPTQPSMYGIFLAAGPDIKPSPPFATRLIDIAPTIIKVLGLDPMPGIDGLPMIAILQGQFTFFLPLMLK